MSSAQKLQQQESLTNARSTRKNKENIPPTTRKPVVSGTSWLATPPPVYRVTVKSRVLTDTAMQRRLEKAEAKLDKYVKGYRLEKKKANRAQLAATRDRTDARQATLRLEVTDRRYRNLETRFTEVSVALSDADSNAVQLKVTVDAVASQRDKLAFQSERLQKKLYKLQTANAKLVKENCALSDRRRWFGIVKENAILKSFKKRDKENKIAFKRGRLLPEWVRAVI